MNKRTIYIVLFVISVGGLAFVQYQYLRIGLSLAKTQFDQNIGLAANDIKSGLYTRNQLSFLVGSAMQKDSSYFTSSMENITEASRFFLDDFIREKLLDHKIEADFSYALAGRDTSFYLKSPREEGADEKVLKYPIELEGYLPDLIGKRVILQLRFRDLTTYFLLQLNGLILPGLLFMAGILITVFWVLRTYYWQRNIITTTNDFINNLTHELRTPVFSISLANKILKQKLSGDLLSLTDIISDQTDKLSGHIDKVLELGSLEESGTVIPSIPFDFKPVLQRSCEEFEKLCNLEGVPFSYELNGETYPVKGSAFHLESAVFNILDNAKKYSDKGKIQLQATPGAKHLSIQITDEGTGMAADELDKVLKKYYRIARGDRHEVTGYGLGLSYVKNIMDRHRAKIKLANREQGGTLVELRLPLNHYGKS
ncbi:sensor histidine kinase [Robiginitalea sp. IMCC43444]|uniref:sensor histidine kinase n=1 Tax=Robiginitalea sp. IMCC43444 TaxID=3459121 RepID=UPI00404301BD